MAQSNDSAGMLDLMIHPGFCVKDNLVVKTNAAADNLRIQVGTPVQKLLATGKKEYSHFTGGCLYLVLDVHGKRCSASVNRMEDMDIFLIDQEAPESLQVLSLAARQLRDPLTSIMSVSGDLFSDFAASGNPHVLEQLARIQRGYYQMLRIIGNMSDAERYSDERPLAPELIDITALMAETFEKANTLLKDAGINFTFSLPRSPVLGLASREMLERAVLNLLSNSLKFTPKGGSVSAALARRGNTLTLTVQDTGEGITEAVRSSIFHRYLRPSAPEDHRHGIGLGMVLVRSAAVHHNGTVLVDCPEGSGIRVTMTIAIRSNPETVVQTPRLRIDYAGELDHTLIELSQVLPPDAYEIK